MKATIRDIDTLRSVRPREVAAYLRAHQWTEAEYYADRYSTWYHHNGKEPVEIMLPLTTEVRDYAARVADLLRALEETERRSQVEIMADIQTINHDVTRIAAEGNDLRDGTIPLKGAAQFVENTYALILAAACSTAQARAVYYSRKPPEATEFIEQVRMGQSERGSYVVTIYAPIPPQLSVSRQPALPTLEQREEPFARRVSETLLRALSSVLHAADRAASSGQFEPFLDAVAVGVSANLCDAIVGLHEGSRAEKIRVRTTWSPIRPAPIEIASELVIDSDTIPIIQAAGQHLRETSAREDFHLEGYIVNLARSPEAKGGEITIAGLVDNEFRNVHVDVQERDYEQAVRAHRDRLPVSCSGELTKVGRSYKLQNVRNFALVDVATQMPI